MTVGISFCQGSRLEAIVITDSQVSNSGRESNSANKVGMFSSKRYNGVVFGSGNVNLIDAVIKRAEDLKKYHLKDFMANLFNENKEREDISDISYLSYQKAEINKRAEMLEPGSNLDSIKKTAEIFPQQQREQFIQQQFIAAKQRYDDYIEHEIKMVIQGYNQAKRDNPTNFVLVSFDREQKKIRQWHFNQHSNNELFLDHIEIGSGADGSNIYFAANLQGIKQGTELKTHDLLFFALNAYNFSTINTGVGSRPTIIKVSKEKNYTFPEQQVSVLANLCGAYLSRFNEKDLTTEKTKEYILSVIKGQKRVYDDISKAVGLNKEALIAMAIPYTVWQERANQKFFSVK